MNELIKVRRSGEERPCVLLLSPGIIKPSDRDFGLPHLVSIGSYLEQHVAARVEIVDLGYECCDQRELERLLERLGPFVLIGITCYSSFDYLRVGSLARFLRVRFPGVPLVAGGYHPSALPADLLRGGTFDAVVLGEGELPLRRLLETRLGGGQIEPGVYGPELVENLDEMPPYRWELLQRYLPAAERLGGKLQIYLSRGCPFRCTFCMERAKQARCWRAFSPERALEELCRLDRFTPLGRWIVNVADPLFGFKRAWRRELLELLLHRRPRLLPEQFWTLTRANELEEEDVRLLARARFAIGVGIESGSPRMLSLMRKTARPERYLETLERFVACAGRHGLSWSGNLVVGHPGETAATMRETHRFVEMLMGGKQVRGWLSIDPFRLYPGSATHAEMDEHCSRWGTRLYHPRWWESWYGTGFRAEHLDASAELCYEERVRMTHELYAPLVQSIARRFCGQGRAVDAVFRRSIDEQVRLLGDGPHELLLAHAAHARRAAGRGTLRPPGGRAVAGEVAASRTAGIAATGVEAAVSGRRVAGVAAGCGDEDGVEGGGGQASAAPAAATAGTPAAWSLAVPVGLQVRDPWARQREAAVRRLLEQGALHSEAVIEALLTVPAHAHLDEHEAQALLSDRMPEEEGSPPRWLAIRAYALALETLQLAPGQRAIDLLAASSYLAALLANLVGERGEVIALAPGVGRARRSLRRRLASLPQVKVVPGQAIPGSGPAGRYDAMLLGAALPRLPAGLGSYLTRHLTGSGRLVLLLGPRFRAQDLVCCTRDGRGELIERPIARIWAPPLAGPHGWLSERRLHFNLFRLRAHA